MKTASWTSGWPYDERSSCYGEANYDIGFRCAVSQKRYTWRTEALVGGLNGGCMTDCDFSKQLIKARAAAGFDTAYKFYHRNGGRKHFAFTFVHYMRIEKGASVPKPVWLERIMLALRLLPTQAEARELLMSYLRAYLGGGSGADYVLAPLFFGQTAPGAGPDSMTWMKAHSSVHLSPEEFTAMAASETAYWCAEALCSDGDTWAPEELAKKLSLDPKAAAKALEALKKAGLVLKTAAGKYKCRHQGKFFTYPGRLEGMGARLETVNGYLEKAGGPDFFERLELVRAEEGAMSNYRLQLAQAMDGANAFAAHSAGQNTGFYLIKLRMRKVKAF